jgi:hypothetical protein
MVVAPEEVEAGLTHYPLVLEMPDMVRYIGFIIAFLVMAGLLWYVNKKTKKA